MKDFDKLMPLRFHLAELRSRLLVCLGSVFAFSVIGFIFWPQTLAVLLPQDMTIIYTSPQEALLVRFRMCVFVGVLFSIPLIIYEVWKFICPALVPTERRITVYFMSTSLTLFVLGVLFNLYAVFPVMMRFFLNTAQPALVPLISISNYTSLVLNMTMAFALVSQMPILMAMATRIGLIDASILTAKRGYAIIGIFTMAAVLTPPDAFSQLALALPMCGLYELGLLLSKLVKRTAR